MIFGPLRGNSRDRDDRGGGFMYYMLQFLFEIVLGLFGMMVVAWFSRRREFCSGSVRRPWLVKSFFVRAYRACMWPIQR